MSHNDQNATHLFLLRENYGSQTFILRTHHTLRSSVFHFFIEQTYAIATNMLTPFLTRQRLGQITEFKLHPRSTHIVIMRFIDEHWQVP